MDALVDYVFRFWGYVRFCSANPIKTLVCHDFWVGAVILFEVIVGILLLRLIYRLFDNWRTLRLHKKKQEAKAVIADEETMNKHKWQGGDSALEELSQEELAAKMRQAGIVTK